MNKKIKVGMYVALFFLVFILSNGLFFNDQVHQPGEVTDSTVITTIVITAVFIFWNEKIRTRKKKVRMTRNNKKKQG